MKVVMLVIISNVVLVLIGLLILVVMKVRLLGGIVRFMLWVWIFCW